MDRLINITPIVSPDAADGVNVTFTFTMPVIRGNSNPTPLVFAGGILQTADVDYTIPLSCVGARTWQIAFNAAPAHGPVTVLLFT